MIQPSLHPPTLLLSPLLLFLAAWPTAAWAGGRRSLSPMLLALALFTPLLPLSSFTTANPYVSTSLCP